MAESISQTVRSTTEQPADATPGAVALSLAETASSKTPALLWPAPPPNYQLLANDVHAWALSLDLSSDALARFAAALAPAETDRAERFRFPRHRDRFVVGRGCLRALLATYLECSPAELEFGYGPNGKPVLSGRFGSRGLLFNQAHSEDLMLVAITRSAPVGIDVERIRPLPDAAELVARFFSRRETEAFRRLPEQDRTICFFNLWTRKEAWLKATGEGITHSLSMVEVAFLPGEPARLLNIAGNKKLAAHWHLHNLAPAPGYAAALATLGKTTHLNCWSWPQP